MIEINNICKEFQKELVLDHINAIFEEKKITGIIGRNGSGKTVLLRILCGLMYPTEGTVMINGKQIGKDMDFPENVGFIIETPEFLPYYSGMKNLVDLASIRHKVGKKEIAKAMELVGLNPNNRKHVGKYSLGMRQRLGIAQAFMEEQDILILDEPLNGLDKQGIEDIRSLFLKFKEQGKTIVIASHSQEDITILCDDVYKMESGILTKIETNDKKETMIEI